MQVCYDEGVAIHIGPGSCACARESVGEALTGERIGQQSTYRTQGRERVAQALERVRQAARQRKKERFTALLHNISIECLRMAFFALKRDAATAADRTRHSADFITIFDTRRPQNSLINSTSSCKCCGGPS